MATTTTNFGWDIPQSTDLVKDGATAIAALGQDIDTAFVDFKGGTTGQVLKKTSGTDLDVEWGTASSGLTLINTTSFSGVTTQSINSVFSSTYRNYCITCDITVAASSGILTLKLRASGSDTSTNYVASRMLAVTSSVSSGENTAGTDEWYVSSTTSGAQGDRTAFQIDVYRPNLAERTMFAGKSMFFDTNVYNQIVSGTQTDTTQFDGFTIIGAGNLTGRVSVYGYSI
jgi:hypothetical protein